MANELLAALWETIYMVALSTLFSGIFGFGIAIIMILTGSKGLRPNKAVYTFLDVAVNLLRSFPFIILMCTESVMWKRWMRLAMKITFTERASA
mgnify:CR=1 FL=1